MKPEEYVACDGLALAELVNKGDVKRSEVLETAITLAEKHNPQLNAICYKAYDQARDLAKAADSQGAKQAFAGVPSLLKDLACSYEGWPETMGSCAYRDNVSTHTDTLTQRYLDAGLSLFGRTTSPEFGAIPVTETALYGDTRNPWNLAHTPGGSSGGASACVAAGIVPLAHASDGGGSIRIPASCAGLVGMKPSRGRNPVGPLVGEAGLGLSVSHIVSRSVRDSAAMLDATSGGEIGDVYTAPTPTTSFLKSVSTPPPSLRVAFWSKYWINDEATDPECVAAIENTAKLLERLGHKVEETRPDIDYEAVARDFGMLWTALAATRMARAKETGHDDFEPFFRELAGFGADAHATDVLSMRERLLDMGRVMGRFHETHDIMVAPTLGTPPLRIGEWSRESARFIDFEPDSHAAKFIVCSPLANVTGQPSLNLPLHISADGLPVGVMLTAAYGREDLLYQLAGQIETAAPWIDKTPPIWG